jgi:hypothetical protein
MCASENDGVGSDEMRNINNRINYELIDGTIVADKSDLKKFNLNNLPSFRSIGHDTFKGLAVFFDLKGFTPFCDHPDYLSTVPKFIDNFQQWLCTELKHEFTRGGQKARSDGKILLWNTLPCFGKFTGDGAFFLWSLEEDQLVAKDHIAIGNIVYCCYNIYKKYDEFLKKNGHGNSNPPSKLRCGIAIGHVMRINSINDYIGSCINMAARLQKHFTLTFVVRERGTTINQCFNKKVKKHFVVKSAAVKGYRDREKVIVVKNEFKLLTKKQQKQMALIDA